MKLAATGAFIALILGLGAGTTLRPSSADAGVNHGPELVLDAKTG